MSKAKRITVKGQQRADIDPQLLMQIILAIAQQDERETAADSIDVGQAAIEVTEAAR